MCSESISHLDLGCPISYLRYVGKFATLGNHGLASETCLLSRFTVCSRTTQKGLFPISAAAFLKGWLSSPVMYSLVSLLESYQPDWFHRDLINHNKDSCSLLHWCCCMTTARLSAPKTLFLWNTMVEFVQISHRSVGMSGETCEITGDTALVDA